jgi:hypothetical protein
MIKLPFVNYNAPLSHFKKCFISYVYLEGINFSSKHNVAPLYWSLPLSVLCKRLKQIMILSDHYLISLLFSLVKEYLSIMNLEISILCFENKNCFEVSLKQFTFEILQLLSYFFSWKRNDLLLCWQYFHWWSYVMRWPSVFMGFKVKGSRESSRFCLRKQLSIFEHSFYQHK